MSGPDKTLAPEILPDPRQGGGESGDPRARARARLRRLRSSDAPSPEEEPPDGAAR